MFYSYLGFFILLFEAQVTYYVYIPFDQSRRMIELVRVHNKLYILSQELLLAFSFKINVNLTKFNYDVPNKFNLWHHKLGYPSHNLLKIIQQRFSIVCDHANSVYDCCHYVKKYSNCIILWTNPHGNLRPFHTIICPWSSYSLITVDDFTRNTWAFLKKNKFEIVRHMTLHTRGWFIKCDF